MKTAPEAPDVEKTTLDGEKMALDLDGEKTALDLDGEKTAVKGLMQQHIPRPSAGPLQVRRYMQRARHYNNGAMHCEFVMT